MKIHHAAALALMGWYLLVLLRNAAIRLMVFSREELEINDDL
jgi:hypothetical protein